MSDLLKRDTTVKIMSVLFAVFLWFFVLDSTNPIVSMDFSVPLRIENENVLRSKDIVIKESNFPRNVTVSLKGREEKIKRINSSEIEAVVDLSKVNDASTGFLYVEIYNIPDGVSFESVSPRTVNFKLEKIGENLYPIEVTTVGKAKENYRVVGISITPQTISIEATNSVISSIGKVMAVADITGIKSDTSMKLMCKVYDKVGNEMPEFSDKYSVEARIEVAKEVSVIPVVKGKPAKDYVDGVHKVSPDKVLISGPSNLLDSIDNLKTESIDIEDLDASVTKTANIVLPSGVNLVNSQKAVSVSVEIVPLSVKKYKIKAEDIIMENEEADDSLTYKIVDEEIEIEIKGTMEELDKIVESKLKPSIDVRGLKEGTYKRTLKVVLPSTLKLSQDVEVEVVIERKNEG
ncbi:CdaR family protein [Acetivibrio clariflavus]|uniref:YbbR domain-containing protein n=1 Tax=Acetivibrio clariflavus (strain DSM 19732 / NBRC 101661 / EBR45) TaxID=720554 RepID=G8LU89_ACECE|nr:CdaR family protein [Acetivibrio clariflavus]AEV69521.1 hypothetical protein Clocl_2982 [Acetivibrio clariflavus DSM 19732]